MNDNLLNYIERQFKKGFSNEEIANALNKAGYDLKIIELYFERIAKRNILKKIFISVFVAMLVFSAGFYLYKLKNFEINGTFSNQTSQGENETIRALFIEAKAYYDKKDWDKALREFTALTNLKPNNDKFHRYLGDVYCKKGSYNLAMKHHKTAVVLKRDNPFSYLSMARCFERQGLHEKALAILNESLYINLNSTASEDFD